MVSKTALEAITDPDNVSDFTEANLGARAVRDQDVVAELRRLEGLSEQDARQLGRDAVAHLGGYIQRGLELETWWIPEYRVRKREL